jgi:hypothetical protein
MSKRHIDPATFSSDCGPNSILNIIIYDVPDLNGLKAFLADHDQAAGFVIGPFQLRRELEGGIQAVPWREFFAKDLKQL